MLKPIDKKIILIIFLAAIIFKIPALSVPYFEDAKFWTVPRGLEVKEHFLGFKQKNLPKELEIPFPKRHPWLAIKVKNTGHPPLFYWMLAAAYFLFGHSLYVSHGVVIVLAALCLCFTYLLTFHLTKGDRGVSVVTSIVLFLSPVFFSQINVLNHGVALAAFSVATLYYYFKQRTWPFLFFSSALVLTKGSGFFVFLPILADFVLRKKRDIRLKEIFVFALPILVFLLWTLLHRSDCGQWINAGHKYVFLRTSPYGRLLHLWKFYFISQYRFLMSMTVLYAFLLKKKRMKVFNSQMLLLCILIFVSLSAYSCFSVPMRPRYFLPILSFLNIVFCVSAREVFQRKKIYLCFIAIFCALSITQWHTPKTEYHLEENLRFEDIIKTKQMTIAFLKENYPHARIWTEGYFYADLVYPYIGYVEKSLNARKLDGGIYKKKTKTITLEKGDIVLEPFYPTWRLKEKRVFFDNLDAKLIKNFQIRQDYVKVYLMNSRQYVQYQQ